MRGYDLPTVGELLQVHGGVSHHLLLGNWERDRPPCQGECKIRFQELNFDAFGVDEPHPITVQIPVHVGIMKLLPAVILLRIDDNQQIRRFRIHLHIPLDVVGIPSIKHLEQDLINLLGVRLGND